MSLASYFFCKKCNESDRKRDEGLEIPGSIKYVRDIPYGRNKKYQILDICWPKNLIDGPVDVKSDKLPVIINVHGGGYVYGTKEVYQFYAASLAKKGFTVINYNYRLAPKYKFPAPLEDLDAVIKWMLDHQDEYPVNPDKVFLVGDSAGAQIASQYGAIYSNKKYAKIMHMKRPKITIRAISFACGTYDLKENIKKGVPQGLLKDYLTKDPSKFGEKLDVLEHITKDYPPTFIFSAKGDYLLEKCKTMATLLKKKGVLCESKIYGDKQTGHVFHVDMKNEFSAQANSNQIEFFKNYL